MWNMNSGYHGFSMSNRAIEAYNNGEKPFSKWTKQDILDVIEEYKQESDDPTIHLFYTVFYELAKVRAGVLKLIYYTKAHGIILENFVIAQTFIQSILI